MDDLDKMIIKELQCNARESFSNIGKKVGLSAPAVGKRVRYLEDTGIIEGYSLKLNSRKIGIHTKAYITLKVHQGSLGTPHAQKAILSMDEVQSCDRITGDDCLCVLGYFRDNAHLISFLENVSKYGTSKTNIILEI
jgi:Lrp/AsnC family leucine-responsive transcriptional regulator